MINIEQKLKKFRKEFGRWLLSNGIPDSMTHMSNGEILYKYCFNYLDGTPREISVNEFKFFLYNWYIRKVTMISEEHKYLVPISMELTFMFLNIIEPIPEVDKLIDVCKDREAFMYRLDSFLALNHRNEGQWEAGFKTWWNELADSKWIGPEFFLDDDAEGYIEDEFEEEENSLTGELKDDLALFFQEQTEGKSEGTVNKYSFAIGLFETFAQEARSISRFHYDLLEVFTAWWYLHECTEPSLNGANNIVSVFNKFAEYLIKQGKMSSDEWPKQKVKKLREDMKRVLTWEREAAEAFWEKENQLLRQMFKQGKVLTSLSDSLVKEIEPDMYFYFRVEDVDTKGTLLLKLDEGSRFKVVLRGEINKYLRPGDFLCAAPIQKGKKMVLEDDYIATLYPPQAQLVLTSSKE